jgi:hypothetical protein
VLDKPNSPDYLCCQVSFTALLSGPPDPPAETPVKSFAFTNAILWAVAIVAAAILGAPATLVLVLLPSLAAVSVLVMRHGRRHGAA